MHSVSAQSVKIPANHETVTQITFTKKTFNSLYPQGELNIFFRTFEQMKSFNFNQVKDFPPPTGSVTSFERQWNKNELQIIFMGKDAYKNLDQAVQVVAQHFQIVVSASKQGGS